MRRKLIDRISHRIALTSSDRFVAFLRKRGVEIGEGTVFFDPRTVSIDYTRPSLLSIGRHVFIHRDTIISTHDWASWSFVWSHNEFIPSHAKVTIGDNVWLGMRTTILKGVTIGENVIIGAGSVVTKSIPSNSVAVGVPAKVIMSYEEYLEKRRKLYPSECREYAESLLQRKGVLTESDFCDDYPIFVNKNNYLKYDFPYSNVFTEEQLEKYLENHRSEYDDFESFVKSL